MCKNLKVSLLLVVVLLCSVAEAQFSVVTNLTDGRVDETSGLIYLDGRIITHNDSGNSSKLYEIDSISGDVIREVNILDAGNGDWEDITLDDEYIYIGDFGNNNGTRTNLAIYKVPIADYLLANSAVEAEKIKFNYAEQVDFSSSQFETDYDAETLISFGDSLLVFTKQWGSMGTAIYSIPKTPGGSYEVSKRAELPVNGLVTGGTYDGDSELLLVGYNGIIPFFTTVEIDNQDISRWRLGDKVQLTDRNGNSAQIEAVTESSPGRFFLTAEKSFSGEPALYRLVIDGIASNTYEEEKQVVLFPNPTNNQVIIEHPNFGSATILDASGRVILTSTVQRIDVSALSSGTYMVKLTDPTGTTLSSHQLIIEK